MAATDSENFLFGQGKRPLEILRKGTGDPREEPFSDLQAGRNTTSPLAGTACAEAPQPTLQDASDCSDAMPQLRRLSTNLPLRKIERA